MNNINAEIWSFPHTLKGYLTNDYVYDLVVTYIKQGILQPGLRLPAYRKVAKLNGLSKTTIQRIYKCLEENGWLESFKGSGTYVARNFPGSEQIYPAASAIERLPVQIGFPDSSIKEGHHFQDFVTIGPDTPSPHYLKHWLNLIRMKKYEHVYEINSQASRIAAMDSMGFKTAIFGYLNSKRNFKINAVNLEVIVGRRESLEQLFNVLLKPNDVVINTSPKDPKIYNILKAQKAVENEIILPDHHFLQNLKRVLSRTKVKALYVRPQCSYPESYTLCERTCNELIELAKQHGFYIVEEDDYHEFWYETKPFKPLICYDHKGHVIYCGALSMISTYLRQTRTIVAPAEFIELIQHKPIIHSSFRDVMAEAVIVDLLTNNSLWKAVKTMQREKKDHMFQAWMQIDNGLNKVVKLKKPSSGLSLWLTFPDDECLMNSISQLEARGFTIPYFPGTQKPANGVKHIRLGFGTWDIMEAKEPVKVLFEKFSLEY